MKTIYLNSTAIASRQPISDIDADTVATIGFFDGVHIGHKWLISQMNDIAKTHNLRKVVVTFAQHPAQTVLGCDAPSMLSTLRQKLTWIAETNADYVVVLDFDSHMAQMTSADFMYYVLKQLLRTRILLTGYDNRFGSDRSATFDDYCRYGKEIGMSVYRGLPKHIDGKVVSSSLIRREIEMGHMDIVTQCLGRPYTLVGRVVKGFGIGHTMGFPTANLAFEETRMLLPLNGVYAVKVKTEQCTDTLYGMMNIGSRPTFGGREQTVEINIFDFDGDLYSHTLQVEVICRIRKEQKFADSNALTRQLQKDKQQCEKYLKQQ